ncbi:MAG: hypothetical protein JRJ51_22285 [Deltaproteobacteria bacterium]|nr:hypothetical protein [Deltaproteobacteria bacterium]
MASYYAKNILLILSSATILPLLVMVCATAAPSHPATGLSTELIEIQTRPEVGLKIFLIKPNNPSAVIVMLEGGPGRLPISGVSGTSTLGRGKGFLVRSRDDFARHGLMVALIDAPSDRTLQPMTPDFRISREYAQDLKAVVSYLKRVTNLPVWLVGMSLGSFSASNGAINIRKGIHGLVLISSPTRSAPKWQVYDSHPNGLLSMDLYKIMVPTLIVVHKEDECPHTPASGAEKIRRALVGSPRVEVVSFEGGSRPRINPRSPAPPGCQPLTQHGYFGIEDQAISAISGFIKSCSRKKKDL